MVKQNFLINKIIATLFLSIVSMGAIAQDTTSSPDNKPVEAPPLFTVINNSNLPLTMVCGTANKPAYLRHDFFDGTNNPIYNTFKISQGLFLNAVEQVICSMYKVKKIPPTPPQDLALAFGFVLIPGVINNELKVKSYIEQNTAFEIITDYKLDVTNGTLTLTLTSTPQYKQNGTTPNPSKLLPLPR